MLYVIEKFLHYIFNLKKILLPTYYQFSFDICLLTCLFLCCHIAPLLHHLFTVDFGSFHHLFASDFGQISYTIIIKVFVIFPKSIQWPNLELEFYIFDHFTTYSLHILCRYPIPKLLKVF